MAKKTATVQITVDQETNENQFKDWLKSCPFSFEGGQSVQWTPEPVQIPGASES